MIRRLSDVQLSLEELNSDAYRNLNSYARQLLVELRALYRPADRDEVELSVRDAMRRLGASQRPVQEAFKALEEHGWIEAVEGGPGRRRAFLLPDYELE